MNLKEFKAQVEHIIESMEGLPDTAMRSTLTNYDYKQLLSLFKVFAECIENKNNEEEDAKDSD